MRRLHINAGELIGQGARARIRHLGEVDSAVLYPNGTIYFRGRAPGRSAEQHHPAPSMLSGWTGSSAMIGARARERSSTAAPAAYLCRHASHDAPPSSPAPPKASAAPRPSPWGAPAAQVGVCARTASRVDALVGELRAAGHRGRRARRRRRGSRAPDAGGRATSPTRSAPSGVLVNNAGVLIAEPFEELTLEDWDPRWPPTCAASSS